MALEGGDVTSPLVQHISVQFYTLTGAISDQSTNTWRRETNKELLTELGQSIFHDMKAQRLRWASHVARSNSSGSLYVTMNASIEGKRRCGSM
ncbi:unnamed protein product [Nezara viridula]|uniref:Uncharacterized protein n=1 Tax=Nezara viridula TaxID=85310 RepID=A0A9P0HG44_NEZVI|nr:unnamed protein product [Nezara viridula]